MSALLEMLPADLRGFFTSANIGPTGDAYFRLPCGGKFMVSFARQRLMDGERRVGILGEVEYRLAGHLDVCVFCAVASAVNRASHAAPDAA